MPELPDVTVYVERIAERVTGHRLDSVRIKSPFVLRTAVPPISEAEGCEVRSVRRMGKRIGSRANAAAVPFSESFIRTMKPTTVQLAKRVENSLPIAHSRAY